VLTLGCITVSVLLVVPKVINLYIYYKKALDRIEKDSIDEMIANKAW